MKPTRAIDSWRRYLNAGPELLARGFAEWPESMYAAAMIRLGQVSLLLLGLIFSMNTSISSESKTNAPSAMTNEVITLGAGCFWCTEAVYQQIPGVVSVKPGYMGGPKELSRSSNS